MPEWKFSCKFHNYTSIIRMDREMSHQGSRLGNPQTLLSTFNHIWRKNSHSKQRQIFWTQPRQKLTRRQYITRESKQLDLLRKEYTWLIGSRSRLDIRLKLLIYATVMRPVWTYGVPLRGSASSRNLKIMRGSSSGCRGHRGPCQTPLSGVT